MAKSLTFTIRLDEQTAQDLITLSRRLGRTRGDIIRRLVANAAGRIEALEQVERERRVLLGAR